MTEQKLPNSRAGLSLDGIRAILFDLDGTLRHSRPSFNHAFFDFATELGVPTLEEKRRDALRWAHYYFAQSPEISDDSEALGQDEDLFLTNYIRRLLIACACAPKCAADLAPRIYSRMRESLQQEDWVDPAVPGMLESLRTAGLKLGVVSNRQVAYHDLLDELGLGPFFHFAVAAGEVNSWKPDEGIFRHALQRAGTCPTCTMYVGDNYYADIVGAQRAGLQPVLFDPEDLFPEVECLVIRSLTELRYILL